MSVTSVLSISETSCKITAVSPLSGKTSETELPMSKKEFLDRFNSWQSGELIQVAFDNLDAGQRELIKTGISPAEWDNMFG